MTAAGDDGLFVLKPQSTSLRAAPVPQNALLVSVSGFRHYEDEQSVTDELAADCAAVIAADMTLQPGHPARVPYRLLDGSCAGYPYRVSLKGGCLPRLDIAPPSAPNAAPTSDRSLHPNHAPLASAPLDLQTATMLIGSILRADRHIRAALFARQSLLIIKAIAWSPNVLMPELSARFSVVLESDKAPVAMAGATALAVACVLLRTADLSNEAGHHDMQPWLLPACGSATLTAANLRFEAWLEQDQAVAALKSLGLGDLAHKITCEAQAPHR